MSEVDHSILNRIFALSNDETIDKSKRLLKKADKKKLKLLVQEINEHIDNIQGKPNTLITYEIDLIERGISVIPKDSQKSFKV